MPLLVTSLLVTFGRPRIYSQQLCDSRWTEFRPGVGKNIEQNFPRIKSHDNTTRSNHLYFQYILRTHLKLSIDDYKRGSEVKYKYLQLSTARKFQVTINAAEWVFHCGADIYVSSIKQGTQNLSHIYAKNRFGLWRFGSLKESAFSANAQSRFASVVVDGVLGPPRLARHI